MSEDQQETLSVYHVAGVYRTLVGEAVRAGARTVVIRFAGCNLWSGKPGERGKGEGACAQWCDADFAGGEALTTAELLVAANHCWPVLDDERWVHLTGGEPMLQVDEALVEALHEDGWLVSLDTNGTMDDPDLLGLIDYLIVSPKLGSLVKVMAAHELRVVLPGALPPDPGWTEEALAVMGAEGQYDRKYVQPQDPIDPAQTGPSYLVGLGSDRTMAGIYKLHLERCVSFVDRHPDWRLAIQQGKHVGLP